ncbi:hypothetical protein [Sandarakinorhabdus sp. AAP62]|uniref:hypothetical protein n=1 Tax=Sandarakinorhabdus sp. AAP62 TaxID=1248916 RepID=UPI00030BCD92|nr:hypothetical protein [Sandarakinorhabdus sp. AAP62]
MFKLATSLLLVALMVSLATPAAAEDKGLGLVTQNNVAAMVVDLNPSYANVQIEGSSGMLADAAITRYRTGRVKPLLPLSGKSELGNTGPSAAASTGNQQQTGPR